MKISLSSWIHYVPDITLSVILFLAIIFPVVHNSFPRVVLTFHHKCVTVFLKTGFELFEKDWIKNYSWIIIILHIVKEFMNIENVACLLRKLN